MANYQITDMFFREWNRIRRKVDSIRGSRVTNGSDYIIIGSPPQQPPRPTPISQPNTKNIVTVRITSNATGKGKYFGKIWSGGSSANATDNLTADDLGSLPSTENALVLNMDELATGSQELLASPATVIDFIGKAIGFTSDNKTIVAIAGSQLGCGS